MAFAAISATLAGVSVQVFFKTGPFAEEYEEVANALFTSSKAQLLSLIDALMTQRTQKPASASSRIFPEAGIDLEEAMLSSIRTTGSQTDKWLSAIGRGKGCLHWMAFYLLLLSLVLFSFLILVLLVPFDLAVLALEYSAGPVVVLLATYTVKYVELVKSLDKAYIRLRRTQGLPS